MNFDSLVSLLPLIFVAASFFFAGYPRGRNKRLEPLESQIERLEVRAGLIKRIEGVGWRQQPDEVLQAVAAILDDAGKVTD